MEDLETVNINEIGLKAKSKHEMYQLLTVSCNMYLPPESYTSIKFIRAVFENERKVSFLLFIHMKFVGFVQ